MAWILLTSLPAGHRLAPALSGAQCGGVPGRGGESAWRAAFPPRCRSARAGPLRRCARGVSSARLQPLLNSLYEGARLLLL